MLFEGVVVHFYRFASCVAETMSLGVPILKDDYELDWLNRPREGNGILGS